MKRLLLILACSALATPLALAQDGSPQVSNVPKNLMRFHNVRPAIPLGSMQSWIVQDGNQQRVAVITADGFTFIGEVYAPGGQDLASALLTIAGLAEGPTSQNPASSAKVATTTGVLSTTPLSASEFMPSKGGAVPSPVSMPPLTMAKAQSSEELFLQATDNMAWFSAGTPKSGAPAIYMIVDPTCPHCAVAVDRLAQKVRAGDIDLRVILHPFRSQQAVYEAASILQSKTPGQDFMSHELSKTTSSPSSLKVLAPTEINPDVARGLQRNSEWVRANGVDGVPFWIYKTAEGAQVAFGEVREDMLTNALPARGSIQAAAQGARP